MTKYVCNALSGQMLSQLDKFTLDGVQINEKFFYQMTRDAESYMGHHDICEKFDLSYNRGNIYLKDGDILYVAQNSNGRTETPTGEVDITEKPLVFFQIFVREK